MRKLFSLFAALTLCVGLWATAPVVGDQFTDATFGLKFEVTAVGEANTVKVIANSYTGTAYNIPATVSYNDVTFAVTEIGESAFDGCTALQSVTIPASVTTIGSWAFGMCSGLTSVTFLGNACQEGIVVSAFMMPGNTTLVLLTLPDNWGDNRPVNNHTTWCGRLFEYEVPVLGDQFVDATSGLKFEVTAVGAANTVKVVSNGYKSTSYTVPVTVKHKEVDFAVTEIGERAFQSCSALTSVTLSEGLTTIGASAFERCKLPSITLPASVTTIGKRAFYMCSALQSITIPASVTTIGSQAFYSCSALTSVTFADGSQLTTIGASAFNGCGNLQTVTLPAALKSIGSEAFQGCSKLTPIVFPTSLDTIGESAFYGCSALESITIPASVDSISGSAFSKCTGLTSIVVEAGNTKYDSRDNCNGIVEKATNTLIAACKNTIIPNTVTILGSNVFYSQPITTITIPASVTTIGSQAFAACSALASVTFLGNACQESIGSSAFTNVGRTDPALLTLPDNWTGSKPVDNQTRWYGGYFNLAAPAPKVGDQFVDATYGLKFEVTAVGEANTVKVIANDYTATSYIIPDTVKYNNVDFAVTEIGESAFERCSSLESVTLPEGLLTIGENAFEECSALQTITIPASVTEIGADAFNSSALQSITIPAGVTKIGGTAFCGCESLQSVTLSEGLLTIGEAAFQSCVSLQSITIPASVTTIGMAAFAGSGLQTITIPAGVISLGMGAFAECADLTSVTFLGNACQNAIGEMAFYEVGKDAPALLTLHGTWAKENQPDEDGNWYGGKFELSEVPTALPTLPYEGKVGKGSFKFFRNGQLFIYKNGKTFNAVGF